MLDFGIFMSKNSNMIHEFLDFFNLETHKNLR